MAKGGSSDNYLDFISLKEEISSVFVNLGLCKRYTASDKGINQNKA